MGTDITTTILEFSRQQPSWQQDLFRRAVTQSVITPIDVEELLQLLKSSVGLMSADLSAMPLSEEHVRFVANPTSGVTLMAISGTQHVNRLVSNQELPFAKQGITLIYGDNGSGKSGYCRILKQLCRARRDRPERVLGDVYLNGPLPAAQAKIRYLVGADPAELAWTDGAPPPKELSRITIFDAQAAPIYVDKQNDIDFLPEGLDVLPRVGTALQVLGDMLDREVGSLSVKIEQPVLSVASGSSVRRLLDRLVSNGIGALPSVEEIDEASQWSEDDARILQQVEEALVVLGQPDRAAARCRRMKAALERHVTALRQASEQLADPAVSELQRLRDEARVAAQAAIASASDTFKNDPFGSDIGTDAWRSLFHYARRFSEVAYPDQPFPAVGVGKHCVLCQQPLSEAASDRLLRFHQFVEQAASRHAANLAADLSKRVVRLRELVVPTAAESEAQLAEYAAESDQARVWVDSAARYCEALRARREWLTGEVEPDTATEVPAIPDWDSDPFSQAAKTLGTEADAHDTAPNVASRRTSHENQRDELKARHLLHLELAGVLQRRQFVEELRKLRKCRAACDTTAISRRATALRDEYLTKGFEGRLRDEVQKLGVDYLPLKVASKSLKGASFLGIALDQSAGARTAAVLSEGEFRVLALATFFAEIGGIDGHDGIIVDDPVSSLDHRHMRQVARRLVQEALARPQVIVFTHSLPFYYELLEAAQEAAVQVVAHWVRRAGVKKCGVIAANEAPWQAKKVKERLATLEERLKRTPRANECSENEYLDHVKGFYGLLRETWERLVEERLLNGVVGRFEPGVKSQSLRGAIVEDVDHQRVFTAMAKISRYSGHDGAVSFQTSLPDPNEMRQDLDAIRSYEKELRKRSEQVEARRRDLESPIRVMTA